LCYASAGEVSAALIDATGFRLLVAPSLALGTDPDAAFLPRDAIMDEGAVLLVASGTVLAARNARNRPLGIEPLAQALVEHSREPAGTLLEIVRDRLSDHAAEQQADWSLLVVQHRRGRGGCK
jgi:serine phosphatase RsbU (regulator of sigma subunit)